MTVVPVSFSLLLCFLLIYVTAKNFFFFVTVDVDDLYSLFAVQINRIKNQENVLWQSDLQTVYLLQYCVKPVKLATYWYICKFFCKFSFKLIQQSISSEFNTLRYQFIK